MFSFGWKKSVQFNIIMSSKVNLCYGNGLAPCYLPIPHESGGWPQATAKLVAHFHSLSQGGNNVPTNKDSTCRSWINKSGQMAAFGYALLCDSETSIKFYKWTDGFADICYWISWYNRFQGSLLICQICIADFTSLWWKFNIEAESLHCSITHPIACQFFYWAQVGLWAWKAVIRSWKSLQQLWVGDDTYFYTQYGTLWV